MSLPKELLAEWDQHITDQFQYQVTANLANFSSLQLEAFAPLLIVKSVAALKRIIKDLFKLKISYNLLGRGSNVVCTDSQQLIILLDFPFDKSILKAYASSYILPASTPLSLLTSCAIRLGLTGWDVFTGIPGSLGGSVVMNAGTNLGELSSLVKRVWTISPEGEEHLYTLGKDDFSYRENCFLQVGEVIWQVELQTLGQDLKVGDAIKSYLQKRKMSQPLDQHTCGCIFKNLYAENQTCLAGKFIDIMGLAGFSISSLKVSHRHANFIEHQGGASYGEFRTLIKVIKNELYLNYGVSFDVEFKVLGSASE